MQNKSFRRRSSSNQYLLRWRRRNL